MLGQEISHLLCGDISFSSESCFLLFMNCLTVSVLVPLFLLVLYYVNDLLIIWDQLTIQLTVPSLVAEGLLFINIQIGRASCRERV